MSVNDFAMTLAAKGVLVLVLAIIGSALLARSSAAVRHMVWSAGLLALLVLPVLSLLVPEWRVTGWPAPGEAEPVMRPAAAPVLAPVAVEAPAPGDAPPSPPAPVLASEPPAAGMERPSASPPLRLSALIWLSGTLTLLGYFALGHARAARLVWRARRTLSPEWEALVEQAHDLAGLTVDIPVLETDDLAVPATVGIFRPVVLVPHGGREWPIHHRRDVLVHELAHVRRRDCLTHALGWTACAIHWMNPLAWIALWRTRVEREHACDDLVLGAGARPSEYAEELLHTARLARVPIAAGAAALTMARRSQLSTRLLAILDGGRRRTPPSRGAALRLGAATLAVLLPVAALAPAAAESATPASVLVSVAVAETPREGLDDTPLPALADVAPVLAAVPAVQAQTLCVTSRTSRNRTVNVNRSMSFSGSGAGEDGSGHSYVVWSGPDCSVAITLRGQVTFTPDESDVATLTRGGRFEVEHVVGDVERRYQVAQRNGALERSWTIDGREAPMDAGFERWRAEVVLEYIRRSGHDAANRARRILARGGVDGLLEEIAQIQSDWGASQYFVVVAGDASLGDGAMARVLGAAGRQLESDHYLAEVLGRVPARALSGSTTRAAYLASTEGIESDHYLSTVLGRVLQSGQLEPAATRLLLDRARQMESDHYLAGLLESLAGTGTVRGELLANYLAAAESIESDHYKGNVLTRLVPEFAGQPALLAQALRAASTIESDHYLGEYLKSVLGAGALDGAAVEPFFGAVNSIESDHTRSEVLVAALGRNSGPMVISRTIESAAGIESDHYLTEVLLAARRRGLNADQEAAWRRVVDQIESSHYRARALGR